jgi:hypothetical protein
LFQVFGWFGFSYPTEFADFTQNQPIKSKIYQKKNMVSTSKVEMSQKMVRELPDGTCRLDPKSKKNYRNIKSTNQIECYLEKFIFSISKAKRSQNFG